MRTRQTSLHKGCGRFDRQKEMETKTPDAAGSAPSSFSADHSYPVISSNTLGNDNEKSSTSSWPVARVTLDGSASNHRTHSQNDTKAESMDDTADSQRPYRLDTPSSLTQSTSPDYEEELAQMLMSMMEGSVGEELADAFREGPRLPPITRQSLSELDIHNIINNVKLRHDINFDRDLSFRPNLDGVRGQEKSRATERYWKALAAELELYTRLFHSAPASRSYDSTHHEALVAHAKRRIPAVFETIKEVLKSLVPDRDHSRVEEHLDVPMLMQEIERGVCDFARLAMWLAQLLKEHCAPMRDSWIDQMVDGVKTGVVSNDTKAIVEGLCVLISILETMKLDVANHQIRNLKPVLIEDTINFEQQYHLDRLVNRRSRVNIDVAEAWYRRASWKYVEQQQMTPALQFEVFTRAVVAQLFNHEGRCNFPETFYLDQDRLRTLKAEIEDLIHMEICLDVFTASLRDLQHDSPVSPALHVQVRNSLTALMGDRLGYGASQWFANSEALSLEILRQATAASGHTPTFNHATLSTANENLLSAFYTSRATHNPHLENTLLQKVLFCTNRNTKSSLMDLFNYSVPVSNSNTPLPTQLPHFGLNHTSSPCIITAPEVAKWQNISNRISHIIILHWRIWKDIAYIPQETSSSVENSDLQPHSGMLAHSPTQTTEQDTPVVASMHTGDASDTGPDAHVAREMSSQ